MERLVTSLHPQTASCVSAQTALRVKDVKMVLWCIQAFTSIIISNFGGTNCIVFIPASHDPYNIPIQICLIERLKYIGAMGLKG